MQVSAPGAHQQRRGSGGLSSVMPPQTPPFPPEDLGLPLPDVELGRLVAQGRLVDAVADGVVLLGRAEELARRLDVSEEAFLEGVEELAAAAWIVAESHPDGRLAVRWERRQHQVPVAVERRRRHAYPSVPATGARPAG